MRLASASTQTTSKATPTTIADRATLDAIPIILLDFCGLRTLETVVLDISVYILCIFVCVCEYILN